MEKYIDVYIPNSKKIEFELIENVKIKPEKIRPSTLDTMRINEFSTSISKYIKRFRAPTPRIIPKVLFLFLL